MPDESSSETKKRGKETTQMKQDPKKDRRMKTLIKNADVLIKDAKALGAEVSTSTELIQKAEKALRAFQYRQVPGLVRSARVDVTEAKRFFRAERMINNVLPLIDQAREMGADTEEATQFLHEAQNSLKKKNFGLVSQNVKNVRNAVRRAKKRKRSSDILEKMRNTITKSEKERLDVSKAREFLLMVEEAFTKDKYVEVQKFFRRMKKAVSDAKLRKKMEDKLQSIQMDLEELNALGVDISNGEEMLVDARQALEEEKYAKLQNLMRRNRRWITRARKKRETEVLVDAMGTLIDKASRGGEDFLDAKELVETFKRALMADKVSDLQELVQKGMGTLEEEDEERRKSARRFLRLSSLVKDMSEHGEDTTGYEIVIRKIKRAFEKGDVEKAEDLMEEIYKTESMFRFSKMRAQELLRKAQSSMMQARNLNMDVRDAEDLLNIAEHLLGEENFLESLENARVAHQMAESLLPEEMLAKRREMEERLSRIKSILAEVREINLDVSDVDTSLQEAEKAASEGRLGDAEDLISEAERLCGELSSSLEDVSKEFISHVRSLLSNLTKVGFSLPKVESMCSTAEAYHKDGKYQSSIESSKTAQNMLRESEKLLQVSAKESVGAIRQGIEQAKATGARVEEAEVLLEDASEAIEEMDYTRYKLLVEKAEGSLKEAESIFLRNRALKELEEVQSLISEAEGIGIGQVEEARIVLRKAKEAFEAKNYGIVSMLTETARELLTESKKRRLIKQFVEKSKAITKLIETAEKSGVDARSVQELLRSAQESFGEDDYEAALKLVEQSEKIAQSRIESFIRERFPKVLVNLMPGAVQAGVWNKYVFELVNEGGIAAEDIEVDLIGDFEVKGLEKVPILLPKERKKIEVGLKPKHDGNVPVDVSVKFKKPLDQTNFEIRKDDDLNIGRLGTYLVDDVFLVHNDGRLILHEAREFREGVDDDIFSGMLTVMQDFVRDSFGSRGTRGLSRMDFGENRVVIERGLYVYLATLLTGEEPALLPLYMAEIVKEIEEEYGDVLKGWTGLLRELEGVEDIVKRLIFVSDDEEADIGELEASVITSTLGMLKDARSVGANVSQAQDLLHKAKRLLEEQDYHAAWRCVEEAAESATNSKAELKRQIQNAVLAAQSMVDEARGMGLEVQKAESLLENVEEAVEEFDVDEVNSIVDKIDKVISAARTKNLEVAVSTELERADEVLAKLRREGVPIDEAEKLAQEATDAKLKEDFESAERYLQMFRETILSAEEKAEMEALSSRLDEFKFVAQNAKELGLDVSEIEQRLRRADEAVSRGEQNAAKDALEEIGELLEEVRSFLSASEIDTYLESVRGMVERAKSLGIEVTDAERILSDVNQMDSDDVENLRSLIGKAEDSASSMIASYVKTRSPDIKLQMPERGLQAGMWNRYVFEIQNEGNIGARDLDLELSGDFDVKGLERIPQIEAGEKERIEIGIKPKRDGDTEVDVKLRYKKYFDEKEYHLDDLKKLSVESWGTYLVEDIFLIHRDGRLIAHETRKHREEIDEDVFGGMLSVVQDFVRDSFKSKDDTGLKRLDFGESKILMEKGKYVSIAAVLVGQEPVMLPLHILEVISKIESEYGEILRKWTGLMSDLSGINEFIRELIFVTDNKEALTKGLKSSLIAETFGVEDAHHIIEEARKVVETEKMETAWDFVCDLGRMAGSDDGTEEMAYPDGTLSPEFLKELGDLAENPEFRGHVAMISEIVHCVTRARRDLGLDKRTPLGLVAIKPADQNTATVISDFKRVIQDHLRTKELIIVPYGEDWEGLDLEIIVNSERIAIIYPQWSRKIQMLLRSQSPWKIKKGVDKGSYSLGIEGQKVSIDKSMVSYEISVPQHIGEYEFGKGVIYVDKTQSDELLAEGYACEIVEKIAKTREVAGIEGDNPIEMKICIGDELRTLLEDWIDDIASEVKCTSFKFRPLDWKDDEDSYSVELRLGEEDVRIYLTESAEASA